jgi:ABC-type lipoprotein release transport system permease subunit
VISALVRPRSHDQATMLELERTFESILPGLAAPEPSLLTERIDTQLAAQRLFARLLRLTTILALVLVTVGLYGVIAFAVASRRRELGIRIALGAVQTRVLGMVVRQGATLALIGIGIGLASAVALTRFLASQLYGVAPTDAVTFALAVAFLMAVAIMLLELFVAFLQAFIFALLSSVFIGQIREAAH